MGQVNEGNEYRIELIQRLTEEEQELIKKYSSGKITEEQYDELMRKEGWL